MKELIIHFFLVLPHQISENEENGKALIEDKNEDGLNKPHEAVDYQKIACSCIDKKTIIVKVNDELVISRV